MKRLGIFFALFAGFAIAVGLAFAQSTPLNFTCITAEVGATTCPDGSMPLSAYIPPPPPAVPPTYVNVAGYFQQSDAGGGEFYLLGAASKNCYSNSSANYATGQGIVGRAQITDVSIPGSELKYLQVGELVSGSGTDGSGTVQVQPGTEIASINKNQSFVTLTLPLTGTSTSTTGVLMNSIIFTGDNRGTLIVDAGGDCWQKTNYRGDPHEFGAWGDGANTTPHDDTAALQNWLGAYGNVNPNLAPATAPNAYGPWIATVPATYIVSSPLTCPQNATIQGNVNLTNSNPVVAIEAASGQVISGSSVYFSGTLPPNETASSSGAISAQAVIGALAYCRLSGISVVGNGYYLPTTGQVSDYSNCVTDLGTTSELQVGNYVVGNNIPSQTTVTSVNTGTSCNPGVAISQNATGSSSGTEPITFYGPDVVDVLAVRVTIDGFSALSNGGNDLVCINTAARGYGLQVKNSQLALADNDDIHAQSGCPNVRFIGDIVNGAGQGAGSGSQGTMGGVAQICGPGSSTCTGTGLYWSGTEMTLADGVIEEWQGIGLDLDGSQKVSVSAMHIQGNGEGPLGGAAIAIANSSVISICTNHMEGNGGDIANSAQIYFSGTLDSINFCGNTYLPQQLSDVAFRPLYVYDAKSGTTVTNFHLYDAPAPQASGQVYSPNAALILPQLQVPHAPLGQISGLALSNDTSTPTSTQVDITPGEASDSTNSVTIELPYNSLMPTGGCTVDLAAPVGPGGLDSGSAATSTTYFYFLIGSAPGGNVNCIASTSTVPNLKHAGYPLMPNGETQSGLAYLYNLSSAAGLAPGQNIQDNSYMPGGTTISTAAAAVGTLTNQEPADIIIEESGTSVTLLSGTTATIGTGMAISDAFQFSGCTGTAQNKLALNSGNWTVASVTPPNQFMIVPPPGVPAVSATNDCITVSGGNAVALSVAATGTTSGPTAFTIFGGVYRLMGVLYTTGSTMPTGTVVPFTQDGDTFYLDAPVADLSAVAVTSSAKDFTLKSVPSGIPVEALGRCVASEMVHIFNPSLAPGKPNSFPNAPGYDTDELAPDTSFPYRSYTNSSGQIAAQAYTSGTMDCMTDGWILHRESVPASGGSGLETKAQRAQAAREKLHRRKPL